ncbi:MocR-like pyridoxine biosynthesis transcription factor PdxR [Dyella sp. 2RAB6]|uniref:MocR-like pyridoxine biosynthesis transcription factor PdxR n=1 Tax=Dyella sp. 2RAB6 TaxID=3232992 RepID=UPI003F90A964
MRRWELTLRLDPRLEQPLFLQLAGLLAEDIRRGRLKPGDLLPGSRELADYLGVNRNTVIAGYDELVAEGLLQTRVGSGTFVAMQPVVPQSRGEPVTLPNYGLAPSWLAPTPVQNLPPGMLALSCSSPDVRLLPSQALARAFRRAVAQNGRWVLTYTDPRGHLRLRTELAAMLTRTRGLLASPDDILITRSIEQGLDLVARTLITPGDNVVIEAFGYPPARNIMQLAGARLLPVAVDEHGLDVDALETVLAHERVRAVLVTPHHQFPTAAVMSPSRRAGLAELALRHRFAIIEDDYDHEFHYQGEPILPMAAGPARANVIYVASMADLLAPGMATGFVVAPPAVLQRLVALRATTDAQGDAAVECAIAELFADGELLRHVRRMRHTYGCRRDALATSLTRHLAGAVEFRVPEGGLALWVHAEDGIDVAAWAREAEREGVTFRGSREFDCSHRDDSFMRLGFSYHDEQELDEAVRRMARALQRLRSRAWVAPTA